jgi:hypothetical protein
MERAPGPINGPTPTLSQIVVKKSFSRISPEMLLLMGETLLLMSNSSINAGRLKVIFDEGFDQLDDRPMRSETEAECAGRRE